MRTSWNDDEDDALQGLPLRAQIIYLRGLRRYMDYRSRICGSANRRISLIMLAEISQEFINRQIQPKPSKDSIRASLEQLKRVGLIERLADPDYLVFYLPKADSDKTDTNKHPTSSQQPPTSHYSATEALLKPAHSQNNPPPPAQTTNSKHPTHPGSDNPDYSINLKTKRNVAPYQAIVDLYHQLLPELPKVYKLNDIRRRHIQNLWTDELDDLASWENYFKHIRRADFLLGKCPMRDGSRFLASFDFIIHPAKFIKIAEEQYHAKKVQTTQR